MGAAKYVGRIGGLAVALGVGAAVATGVASAEPASEGPPSSEASDPSPGGTPGASGAGASRTGASTPGTPISRLPSLRKDGPLSKLASLADPATRRSLTDRRTITSPGRGAKDDTRDETKEENKDDALDDVDGGDQDAGGMDSAGAQDQAGADVDVDENLGAVQPSTGSGRTNVRTFSLPFAGQDAPDSSVSATTVVRSPLARAWLSSPQVAAGRTAAPGPAASPALLSLPTAPAGLMTSTALSTIQSPARAIATPVRTLTSVVAGLIGPVFDPFAGNSPVAPTDSPTDWMVAAFARRDFSGGEIVVDPVAPVFQNGVIQGSVTATSPNPLTYTVIDDPSLGGKVFIDATGNYAYLPDLGALNNGQSETFTVLISETTPFVTALEGIPLLGDLVQPIIVQLHQIPVLGVLLQPIIGRAVTEDITVNASQLVPAGQPVAFTTFVTSFDGTQISVNFFPAVPDPDDEDGLYPTILNGPGLATAGNIDPNSLTIVDGIVPGLAPLRDAGYNVVTWDPRGEFASGAVLQLDSPAFEGQDVTYIIDWLATQPGVEFDSDDPTGTDPLIGMVGGSYGGGIQWVTAGIDPRVDAIVPGISWNTLPSSLYTNEAFKTSYSALLLLGLVETGARINPQIYAGIFTGALLGILTPSQQLLLANSGPNFLLGNIDIPVLVLQGTVDVLFPLQQSVNNIGSVPTEDLQVIWFCGGHGVCLTNDADAAAFQEDLLMDRTIAWLDLYLKGEEPDPDLLTPTFTWVDQNGTFWYADDLPSDPKTDANGFYGPDVVNPVAAGGLLPIIPLLGGSGPQSLVPLPYSLGLGSDAKNAVNVPIENPDEVTHIVGAPQLTMTYSGVGTSRHVYAQIVDKDTGLVVGNIVTPIPVTLDGKEHTVVVPMEAITFTTTPDTPGQPGSGSNLELQIVTSATPYLNFTQYGVIDVKSVGLSLPTAREATELPGQHESELAVVA